MKKILLLFVLLIASLVYGQNANFKSLDTLQFNKNCEKILLDTGKNFKSIKTGELDSKKYIKYANENDSNEVFYIVYFTKNEGENKDLEIKGEKKWNIDSVAGKYLIVYDLYKKYFNPKADKENIQKMGMEWNPPQSQASIRKTSQEGLWEIKFF